jgi:hypothetical protein
MIIRSPRPQLGEFVPRAAKRLLQHYLPEPEVSRFIDPFGDAFFLAKVVRLYQQKPARFWSSSSHNIAPIVIRSHFLRLFLN